MKRIFLAGGVALLAGAGYWLFFMGPALEQQVAAPEAQIATDAQSVASFNERFEKILNDFLKDVNDKAQAYKKQRKVVTEVVRPQSVVDPAYVDENYKLMQTIIPQMQAQMDDIMSVFRTAEENIRKLLEEKPPESREALMNSWRSVRDKQATLYLAFFNSEQDVLQAYANLMSLYYERKGSYSYDESTSSLIFKDSTDKQMELELRQKIQALEQQQAEAMRAATAESNSTESEENSPE